jgi:hypothetical protein
VKPLSQKERVLRLLKSGKPVTPLLALRRFGCMRLGARIWELREAGHRIVRRTVERGGKHFAEYRLVERPWQGLP